VSVPGTYLVVFTLHVGRSICMRLQPMAQQMQCDSGGGNGNETPEAACVLCTRIRVSPNACGSERPHLQLVLMEAFPIHDAKTLALISTPVRVFMCGAVPQQ
jgi:hypothetical protein